MAAGFVGCVYVKATCHVVGLVRDDSYYASAYSCESCDDVARPEFLNFTEVGVVYDLFDYVADIIASVGVGRDKFAQS